MILRWSRRAAGQLFDAADYLEKARPGSAERLYAEVDLLASRIKEQPWSFASEPHALIPAMALDARHPGDSPRPIQR